MVWRSSLAFSAVVAASVSAQSDMQPIPPAEIGGSFVPLVSMMNTVAVPAGIPSNDVVAIWSDYAQAPGSPWMRVHFDAGTALSPADVDGCTLRLTSSLDGEVQYLNDISLPQWSYTSAYFNGDAVKVELLCTGDVLSSSSRVGIAGVTAGDASLSASSFTGFCTTEERREAANEKPMGRYLIEGGGGCSAWIIGGGSANPSPVAGGGVTAGHCGNGVGGTLQFDVPPSSSNGTLQHPPPSSQFSMDPDSIQYTFTGVGNDWKVYGLFPNSNTGLSALDARDRDAYELTASMPNANDMLEHMGCGSSPVPEFTQTQKGSRDVLVSVASTSCRYRVDTTPGDSGSAVSMLATDSVWGREVIAIATHAGCSGNGNPSSTNIGNRVTHPDMQNALANPRGVLSVEGAAAAASGHYGDRFRR